MNLFFYFLLWIRLLSCIQETSESLLGGLVLINFDMVCVVLVGFIPAEFFKMFLVGDVVLFLAQQFYFDCTLLRILFSFLAGLFCFETSLFSLSTVAFFILLFCLLI